MTCRNASHSFVSRVATQSPSDVLRREREPRQKDLFVSAVELHTLHHRSCKNLVSCTNRRRRAGDHGRCYSCRTDVISPEGLGTPDLIVLPTSETHVCAHTHGRHCKTHKGVVKRKRHHTADGQTRMWLAGRFLFGSHLQQGFKSSSYFLPKN